MLLKLEVEFVAGEEKYLDKKVNVEENKLTKTDACSIFTEIEKTEKYVAFIDILGYKDKIDKCEKQGNLKDVALLNFIMNNNRIDAMDDLITFVFSDCMYIVGDELQKVLELLACISIQLLGASKIEVSNFAKETDINLIRGAITKGSLIVDERLNTLLGPAVNEVYILESQIAIYPRIIISNKIVDCESGEDFGEYFKEDRDGIKYFDFLLFLHENKKYIMSKDEINRHITFLKEYIENSDNVKIIQKYKWFEKYLSTRSEDTDE